MINFGELSVAISTPTWGMRVLDRLTDQQLLVESNDTEHRLVSSVLTLCKFYTASIDGKPGVTVLISTRETRVWTPIAARTRARMVNLT